MDNKYLQPVNNEGFFSKVKNWFKSLFSKENENFNAFDELEFEKSESNNSFVENPIENKENEKIQYKFNSDAVSNQKIDKIKSDLDNGKADIEDLYQLSKKELDKISQIYEEEINDTSAKLVEVNTNIQGYQRKLEKLAEQSSD